MTESIKNVQWLLAVAAMAPTPVIATEAPVATTVRGIVAEGLGVSVESAPLDARLVEDLGADSLDLVEIALALEDTFGIAIADAAAEGVSTVADVVRLVGDGARGLTPQARAEAGVGGDDSPSQAERQPAAGRPEGTATRARPRPQPTIPQPATPEEGRAPPQRSRGSPLAVALPTPTVPEESTAPGYAEALKAYYDAIRAKNRVDEAIYEKLGTYDTWALENRKRVIEWQQTAAKIVLAVVVFLVLSGVVFSAIQFYIAMRHAQRGAHAPTTTLKASLGSVEVSSSVLGILVLVISLLFFYLYLDRVFALAILPN